MGEYLIAALEYILMSSSRPTSRSEDSRWFEMIPFRPPRLAFSEMLSSPSPLFPYYPPSSLFDLNEKLLMLYAISCIVCGSWSCLCCVCLFCCLHLAFVSWAVIVCCMIAIPVSRSCPYLFSTCNYRFDQRCGLNMNPRVMGS
jgi:hypothetical protein